ncbi:GNAT family N-acetyltransferase [Erythrobacter crassostreae]|uniref:GNAT family N-acetyltransferase n=1 Tax=Erythrobacter crassostreae TaxID=2828328 RepID=A0A9X1F3D1_9SPHN|nr:GNAT family N-acetyltransferase [Erythrobacter crassostrea]
MFHRSDRLLLRPIWPEDWQGVLSGIADEGVVRNLASAPWPYAAEDARKFVSLPIDPMFPRFLITRARDAQVVGCIGIDAMDDDAGVIELGYWIARPYWGQGFATEAGAAALKVARALGHQNLVASHFLDNPASGAVLRKLGFKPTGRVVERHSCGRGEDAPTAEYELSLRDLLDESVSVAA